MCFAAAHVTMLRERIFRLFDVSERGFINCDEFIGGTVFSHCGLICCRTGAIFEWNNGRKNPNPV